MRVVSVSYYPKSGEQNPEAWLRRLNFYMGILEALSATCGVVNIELINWEGELLRKGVRNIFLHHTISFQQVNRRIKQLQPELVLVQGFLSSKALIHLRLILGGKVKIVVQHHAEWPFRNWKSIIFKLADRCTDLYFFASTAAAQSWIDQGLISAKKPIVSLAECSSIFHFDSNTQKEQDSFLWVGRLDANKDPLTTVKAFQQHLLQFPGSTLYMVFAKDELLDEVSAFIQQNGLNKNIILVGKQSRSEMQQWFNRCQFIICSSFYEGCNVSVIEGMSCGCVPIVTNIPSFDLHTNKGRLGWQFTPGDANDLAGCLQKAIGSDRRQHQQAVLQYFDSDLSFKAVAAKMADAFKVLCGKNQVA